MIKLSQSGGVLQVVVDGDCDYATSRELLLSCKDRLKNDALSNIKITLDNATVFHTCAIGALLLLSEAVHGRLHVNLKNCAIEVHQLFEDASIKKRINAPLHVASSSLISACAHCFIHKCLHPGPGRLNPGLAV